MLDQVEDLLKAGIWLGPSVLGSLFYRFVSSGNTGAEDLAGAVMLATAALVLTLLSARLNGGKNAAIAPLAFIAMFAASWSML